MPVEELLSVGERDGRDVPELFPGWKLSPWYDTVWPPSRTMRRMRGAERGCRVAEALNHHPRALLSFVALTGVRADVQLRGVIYSGRLPMALTFSTAMPLQCLIIPKAQPARLFGISRSRNILLRKLPGFVAGFSGHQYLCRMYGRAHAATD